MVTLWFEEVKDRSNFWDGNRVECQKVGLSLYASRSVPPAATRCRVRCPYPTEIYFRRLRANPRRLILGSDIQRGVLSVSLLVCHLTPMAYTRASLRFWRSSLFGAATNWKLPSRARAIAVRLRLIDFFDKRGTHRGHGRPALPFSDETHDRDREKRDARG